MESLNKLVGTVYDLVGCEQALVAVKCGLLSDIENEKQLISLITLLIELLNDPRMHDANDINKAKLIMIFKLVRLDYTFECLRDSGWLREHFDLSSTHNGNILEEIQNGGLRKKNKKQAKKQAKNKQKGGAKCGEKCRNIQNDEGIMENNCSEEECPECDTITKKCVERTVLPLTSSAIIDSRDFLLSMEKSSLDTAITIGNEAMKLATFQTSGDTSQVDSLNRDKAKLDSEISELTQQCEALDDELAMLRDEAKSEATRLTREALSAQKRELNTYYYLETGTALVSGVVASTQTVQALEQVSKASRFVTSSAINGAYWAALGITSVLSGGGWVWDFMTKDMRTDYTNCWEVYAPFGDIYSQEVNGTKLQWITKKPFFDSYSEQYVDVCPNYKIGESVGLGWTHYACNPTNVTQTVCVSAAGIGLDGVFGMGIQYWAAILGFSITALAVHALAKTSTASSRLHNPDKGFAGWTWTGIKGFFSGGLELIREGGLDSPGRIALKRRVAQRILTTLENGKDVEITESDYTNREEEKKLESATFKTKQTRISGKQSEIAEKRRLIAKINEDIDNLNDKITITKKSAGKLGMKAVEYIAQDKENRVQVLEMTQNFSLEKQKLENAVYLNAGKLRLEAEKIDKRAIADSDSNKRRVGFLQFEPGTQQQCSAFHQREVFSPNDMMEIMRAVQSLPDAPNSSILDKAEGGLERRDSTEIGGRRITKKIRRRKTTKKRKPSRKTTKKRRSYNKKSRKH
jgi:hypothetical protein